MDIPNTIIIEKRNGVPVFSDPKGATKWGRLYGLKGYHKVKITIKKNNELQNFRNGYIAGENFAVALNALPTELRY